MGFVEKQYKKGVLQQHALFEIQTPALWKNGKSSNIL